MMRICARLGLLLALACAGAHGQDRPATMPTRDVDVVYAAAAPGGRAGAKPIEQRMRWSVAPGMMRLDPPTPDLYFVMDYRNRRLTSIRPSLKAVVEMDAAGAGLPATVPNGGQFDRKGDSMVAGLSCTEWQTRDAAGEPALACLTADGVLLRASSGGRVLIEAKSVHYGTIDPSVFAIPAGYTKLAVPTPPPAKGAGQ